MTPTLPRSANVQGRSVDATEKVCIFSHFDGDSVVRRYVFEYVRAIVSCGFSVLFVSTADRITQEDRDRLEALGIDVHLRENKGLDFGSWQYGMTVLGDMEHIDQLLLANDSVFGPLFDLKFMVDQMNGTDADFWGVTDSYEGNWHLQSYFLCFHSNVVRSRVFRDFFTQDFGSLSKQQIIIRGEIALSQRLTRAGFYGAASCPYGALTEDKFGRLRDPTHHYWDELIEICRCPFIKRLLLRENPNGVKNLDRWREVIERSSDYDLALIDEYLATFGQKPRKNPILAKASSYLRQIPIVLSLAIRAAVKTCRHPRGTVLALEQFLATDRNKMPLHPGRRPKTAYADLKTAVSDANRSATVRIAGKR